MTREHVTVSPVTIEKTSAENSAEKEPAARRMPEDERHLRQLKKLLRTSRPLRETGRGVAQ